MKGIVFISPMWPTAKWPNYGVFIKSTYSYFELNLAREINLNKLVIAGKGVTKYEKICKHVAFGLRLFLKCFGGKVYYIHAPSWFSVFFIFYRIIYRKCSLVIHLHGSDLFPVSMVGRLSKRLVMKLLRVSDLVVTPSVYFTKKLPAEIQSKTIVSPSGGVDTKLFRPEGVKKNDFTVGFVGRIDPGKGAEHFVHLCNLLRHQYNMDFIALMIGSGSLDKEIDELIDKLNIDYIKRLPFQPREKLVSYYNSLDILLFLSESESLGLVPLEAMSCSVPVIAFDCGAVREYIRNKANGFIVSQGNVEEAASTVYDYFNLVAGEKNKIKKNARALIVEKYCYEHVNDSLLKKLTEKFC